MPSLDCFLTKLTGNTFVGVCLGFVEVGNFALQVCNVREKDTYLQRPLGNFEILEYLFPFEHFQKSICRGTFSLVLELH